MKYFALYDCFDGDYAIGFIITEEKIEKEELQNKIYAVREALNEKPNPWTIKDIEKELNAKGLKCTIITEFQSVEV